MKQARAAYRDENKNNTFAQEDAWEILRKHAKWDAPAPAPAPVDLTKDEEITEVSTDELFGPDTRPRPPGKQRPCKKTKPDTSVSTGGSSSSSQFGDIMTKELRLKREAAEAAFEVAKEKDRTVMRLEKMKFLAISTKDLPEDDAYFIEEQKKTIRAKYNLTWFGVQQIANGSDCEWNRFAIKLLVFHGPHPHAGKTANQIRNVAVTATSETPKRLKGCHQKEYRPVTKKPNACSSRNKKKGVEPTIKVSNSNSFYVLNSVDNDVEFDTNGRTTKLINNEATSSGSSYMNINNDEEFVCNTPVVPKGIVESDNEVEVVFDETANLRISTSGKDGSDKGYGTNSLLEQWRDSYSDNDDYDPYDDDIYENHDLSEHMQTICDDLDITVCGRKKK
uniref:Uncharacterized protein n=1 Tax=Tanacetum cinerariifolium TaxID=118510 RepID=A0A699HR39_TANCI|nr:hypothetical protein [Tanacetum cinerariifolium]